MLSINEKVKLGIVFLMCTMLISCNKEMTYESIGVTLIGEPIDTRRFPDQPIEKTPEQLLDVIQNNFFKNYNTVLNIPKQYEEYIKVIVEKEKIALTFEKLNGNGDTVNYSFVHIYAGDKKETYFYL